MKLYNTEIGILYYNKKVLIINITNNSNENRILEKIYSCIFVQNGCYELKLDLLYTLC